MSVRQQLALIKQMEQPSPSSSVDGEGGSASINTPGSSRKRVSRVSMKILKIAEIKKKNPCNHDVCLGA